MPALADRLQRGEDEVDDRGSEAERRLVEEQDRRPRDERPCDRELLLLATGQGPRLPVPKLLDDREQLGDVGDVRVGAVRARASREPEPEVLVHRELCEEASPLGDECDTGSRDGLGRASAKRPVAEADLASASGHEPHDRVQRRRLPGAVRADEPDELAGRDGEREAADGSDAAVGDLEVTELEGAAPLNGALAEVGSCDVDVSADLARRALRQRPALVEHLDAVADVHDQRHVVIDEEHARVVLVAYRAHDLGEGGHLRLGEACRGLVHEHEPGLGRERTGDAEAALVPVRERACRRVRVGPQLERLEQLVGAAPCLPRTGSDAERRHLHVLPDGEPAERAAVLEGAREPGPAPAMRPPARHVPSFELDRAVVGEVEPGENVHERRLAGPVRDR